jgi:D-alanine-D-alanine ligase
MIILNDEELMRRFDGTEKEKRSIEILIVPSVTGQVHQKNVAINIDPQLIQRVLSKFFTSVQVTEISSIACLDKLVARKPDLVFSGVKYFTFGPNQIWLNDILDREKIPYIGSARRALENEHDKSIAKKLVRHAGITTADYFTVRPEEFEAINCQKLNFPLFVKPLIGGDSRGIDSSSVVYDQASLKIKIKQIFDVHGSNVLVERYLSGAEFSVGILEDEVTKTITAMPIEILAPVNDQGDRVLDYNVKKNDSEVVIKVADQNLHNQLSRFGTLAFKALGGRSFGRIDIRLCHNNVLHFMEANLMPGLSNGYFFRSCALNLDINYDQMIRLIARNRLT